MSVMRVGSTKKFADNWDNIFGGTKGKKSATKGPKKKASKKTSATKGTKKKGTKKQPAKKRAKRK